MNKMTVSPLFSLSSDGPVAASTRHEDLVHLRQGDIDGACGPYCLCMALLALGLFRRADLSDMDRWDGRTREGRFRDSLLAFGALVSEGTWGEELVWLTDFFKSKGLIARPSDGKKSGIFQELVEAIDEGAAPIVGVRWHGGGGHWLLVVGYQGVEIDGDLQLTHLLCLDPGQETPRTSLWNAVIEVFQRDGSAINRGSLSSDHWGLSGAITKCHIEESVILSI